MIWNKAFWIFFAVSEFALLAMLWLEFSAKTAVSSALILFLGVFKLADDYRIERERKRPMMVRVRKAILKRIDRL